MSAADDGAATLILTALAEETSAVRERLRGVSRLAALSGRVWRGQLAGRSVLLAETGVGPLRAASGLSDVLGSTRAGRWIGAGLAGALAPELAAGEILIAASVADADGIVASGPDPAWAARALSSCPPARSARFFSAGRVAATAAQKASLRVSAAEAFDAVDMESAAWARGAAAAGHDAPYLLVRVVSDTAMEELPDLVAASAEVDGSLDRGRIARNALRHPSSIGKLLHLRRRARSCARSLADFLARFAAAGF